MDLKMTNQQPIPVPFYDETSPLCSQDQKEKSNGHAVSITDPTESEIIFRRRVWAVMSFCCVLYVVSFLSLSPLSVQLFSYRIARDKYQFTYNDSSNFKCGNASSQLEKLIDHVQKEASQILLEGGIISGVPACITCILVGSYSDYLGRKPVLVASIFGGFIRLLVLTFIVKFEWNIRLYYIGAAIDGMVGSYFTLILATTAMIADITPDAKNRAVNFALIEGLMLPTAAAAQIGVGYLIRFDGFFLPVILLCGLLLISLLSTIFILPETVKWKKVVSWHPKIHIKKVVGFYFLHECKQKKRLYILGLCAFILVALTNIGRQNVETLFELNHPICWDSVQIGIYTAIRIVGSAAITILFLRMMRNRLSLEYTGVVCALSGIAGFVVFGLSQMSAGLYIAGLLGSLYFGCIPIPRALLSQLTPPTEQGALFSGLSVVETMSSLISSTLFTLIYYTTINSFKGAVFFVIASFTFVNVFFLVAFRLTRADASLTDFTQLIEPGSDDNTSPSTDYGLPPSQD